MNERLRHLEATEQFLTGAVDPNAVVSAAEGTPYWDNVANNLYYNTNGFVAWQLIGGGAPFSVLETNGNVLVDEFTPIAIFADSTPGNITVSMPTIAGIIGKRYIIKNTGTNFVIIDGLGAETIDGQLTVTLNIQYESVTIIATSVEWSII